jgi:hypothetical protein
MKIPTLLRRALPGLVLCLSACSGSAEPPLSTLPSAGMAGQRMAVVPVQRPGDYAAEAEDEMVYALEAREGSATWIFPDEVRSRMARAPGLDAPVDALPVDVFLRAEVERVGDPLYGMLRRIAAVTDADRILIPVGVSFRPERETEEGEVEEPAVQVLAAVVDVLTGRVLWLGVAEGDADDPDDPGGLPRAMEALAATLLPAG